MAGVTWRGGYLAPGEEATVARLVELLGIEHRSFDPSEGEAGAVANLALVNSGGYGRPSRLTQAMARNYPPAKGVGFVRGYGGEIIRGFYNASTRPLADFSAAAMQKAYQNGGRVPSLSARVEAMFEEFRERGNYAAVERSGFDPSDIFYWEHRMGMWGSAMLNEMDAAMPSFVGFNDRAVYAAAFGLPDDERLTGELLAQLTARLDPEIGALGTPGRARVPRREPADPVPAAPPVPAATKAGACQAQGADLLYHQYVRWMVHCLGVDARSIVDVGPGSTPHLEWFDWIAERVSIDIRVPYRSETVRGIQGDILALEFDRPFDLCTCLQVLERIPDPSPFARRLLELGRLVLVSVPYMWPKRVSDWHCQDPVDLKKLTGWFGRAPNYHLVVQEPFAGATGARLLAVFDAADPWRRFGIETRRPLGATARGAS